MYAHKAGDRMHAVYALVEATIATVQAAIAKRLVYTPVEATAVQAGR